MATKAERELMKQNIIELRNNGYSQKHIAQMCGVHRTTVKRCIDELEQSTTAGVVMSGGITMHLGKEIDVVAQLRALNQKCWDTLNNAIDSNAELAAAKEIRGQLKLHVELLQKIYDAENVQRFQRAVLEALQDTDPKLRDEAIRRINQLKEMAGVTLMSV